jgi:phosphoglycolate phosphatase-like HAD superfamily hydrolase
MTDSPITHEKESQSAINISPSVVEHHIAKVLLFDFDGTIADTRKIAHGILNDMSKEFGFRQLPEEHLENARNMGTREFIRHLGISTWKVPSIARRGLALLHERMDQVNPIEGMPEVLKQLHGRGHRIGILTSNSEANVNDFLKRHDLPYFYFVRTSSKLFGKAREMKRLVRAEGITPGEILYVGDETRDIEAAKESGIRMAAVTWGYNSESALAALNPEHILNSPAELLGMKSPSSNP